MKDGTKIVVLVAVLFGMTIFGNVYFNGLWTGTYLRDVGMVGPGVVVKNGGSIVVLGKDGRVAEITPLGGLRNHGQAPGVSNFIVPPAFFDFGSTTGQYIAYSTFQQGTNYAVFHRLSETTSSFLREPINGASMGMAAYADRTTGNEAIVAFVATTAGSVYRINQSVDLTSSPATDVLNLPGTNVVIKTPPILSPDTNSLYVMTSNGTLYRINTSAFTAPATIVSIGDQFSTPMIMDDIGQIYILGDSGTLYKIEPASGNTQSVKYLSFANSAGPLIDGDGFIYLFGDNGKVVVLNRNLTKIAEFAIGQTITTTPAIVRGTDGRSYIVIASSASVVSGKITILSFNGSNLTLFAEFATGSNFRIAAAIGVAPLGALNSDDYVVATADTDGKVYAWRTNARGPYGVWALYGANSYRTNFIDSSSILFRTRIFIRAVEGYNGRELSSQLLGNQTDYGLTYLATVVNADNSPAATGVYRTNNPNIAQNPQGIPGSQRLVVSFATPTSLAVLLTGNFRNSIVKGGTPPATDSAFRFRMWDIQSQNAYEGNEADNPATLTFRFSDRTVRLFTDATYTYYIYHKYPLQTNSEATEVIEELFDYNAYRNNPNNARVTISSSPTQSGRTFYAFKWDVYRWEPSNPNGYVKTEYIDRDSLEFPLSGPHYIEIYYAELSATITLSLPQYGTVGTKAYLYLDVATNTVAHQLRLRTKEGVTIRDRRIEVAPGVNLLNNLTVFRPTEMSYVLENMNRPLEGPTRVATVTVTLDFATPTNLYSINNDIFERYFELYGYTQVQGQLVDERLRAKNNFRLNKYLYLPGDFNGDWTVDANDWILFLQRLGTQVAGADRIYNIGPRSDFSPPYPNLNNYTPGMLIDTTNNVDANDLFIFVSMFGIAIPESFRY